MAQWLWLHFILFFLILGLGFILCHICAVLSIEHFWLYFFSSFDLPFFFVVSFNIHGLGLYGGFPRCKREWE